MSRFKDKSKLEKTVVASLTGVELGRDEKRRYLGSFRERVIEAVTFDQLKTNAGLEAIKTALGHPRAAELVVHGKARTAAMPLIGKAQREGVGFKIVADKQFIGDIAVTLIAKDAVDIKNIMAEKD